MRLSPHPGHQRPDGLVTPRVGWYYVAKGRKEEPARDD
jgi:hypothetical protein